VRDFPAALRTIDQALAVWPDDTTLIASKAEIYQALGQLDQADALLSRLHPKEGDFSDVVEAICDQAMLRRDPAAAITLLRTLIKPPNSAPPLEQAHYNLHLGELEGLSGNANEAWTSFTQAREALEKELQQQPQDGTLAYMLARTLAGLGEREGALRWADRAVELSPSSHDARSGPGVEEMRARIQARFGDGDRAIPTLKHLLEIPYAAALTPALLRLHPDFDPLRGDPRFQELCKDEQPLLSATTQIPEKSIAVLPFENLSDEKANAYFADGIQNEILTRLASVRDLKVISRTSTAKYQSKPDNLRTIAQELGVSTILEGAVQKAGDKVRVNVQLINAQTDSHLWAETYDRKLTDVFGIESEVSRAIADQLRAKLTGREEQALAVKPTNNPDAYDAYLRGLAFEARSYYSTDLLREATGFYERAVQLDPKFAIAWARLSRLDAWFYFNRVDAITAGRGDAAKSALENAQKLEPNSSETLLALGYYQYWVLLDYGPAKTTFERVSKMLPGNSEAPMALGLIVRREGHWDQSIAYFEQALTLDPRNVELLHVTALTYAMLRQFAATLKLYDRALDITPNDPEVMACKAGIYQAQGNLQEAARLLVEVNEQTTSQVIFGTKVDQLRLERNHGEAIRLLQARLAQFRFGSEFEKGMNQVSLAMTQRLAGDATGAKATAEQARNTLEQLYRNQPDRAFIAATLSQAFAVMGQKDSAVKLAERAIMLLPMPKERRSVLEENLALIQTIVGENSRAISNLTQLLRTPYSSWLYKYRITPALLRLDPFWDPLRADPAFQKLCEEKQP
jgi:TolB-like protein/predicted Zn-dependent protease